jgi:hypothetical protein
MAPWSYHGKEGIFDILNRPGVENYTFINELKIFRTEQRVQESDYGREQRDPTTHLAF